MGYHSEVAIVVRPKDSTTEELLAGFRLEHPDEYDLVVEEPLVNVTPERFVFTSWQKWYTTKHSGMTFDGCEGINALEKFAEWCQEQSEDSDSPFYNDGVYIVLGEELDDNTTVAWGDDPWSLAQIVRSIDIQV